MSQELLNFQQTITEQDIQESPILQDFFQICPIQKTEALD